MKLTDLIAIYEQKKKIYGDKAYLHVSEIFEEAREHYKNEYLSGPRAAKLRAQGKTPDAEQSWKAFKGKNFEKVIWHMIDKELQSINLRAIPGNQLERKRLSPELSKVYRNLLIRYGQWALLPDVDLVIYEPATCSVIGIVSCKITLRERIAQTAYWKLKLLNDPLTMHIKGYFITTDEDGDLVAGIANPSRNRIIVEHELDGTYTLREVAESEKVKAFPKFIADLRKIVSRGEKHG
ncbi:MAG: DNA modification methylase [Chloroflexi bacterium CG_4_10_14_0_8_um_filter_46_9]|nr:MAG: DNA modification methylase [Chloroflexi bacterium CG15_BIG_FIL_POST_REV_8_21_14_020_46_15]PIZ26579.1 MAG: DNA modification methylase [Chloroflexi bacterium CG_4_10_14_0_8_um_filter_46_9]